MPDGAVSVELSALNVYAHSVRSQTSEASVHRARVMHGHTDATVHGVLVVMRVTHWHANRVQLVKFETGCVGNDADSVSHRGNTDEKLGARSLTAASLRSKGKRRV